MNKYLILNDTEFRVCRLIYAIVLFFLSCFNPVEKKKKNTERQTPLSNGLLRVFNSFSRVINVLFNPGNFSDVKYPIGIYTRKRYGSRVSIRLHENNNYESLSWWGQHNLSATEIGWGKKKNEVTIYRVENSIRESPSRELLVYNCINV